MSQQDSMEAILQVSQDFTVATAPTADMEAAEEAAHAVSASAEEAAQAHDNSAREQHAIGTAIVPELMLLPLQHGPPCSTLQRVQYVSQAGNDEPSTAEWSNACDDSAAADTSKQIDNEATGISSAAVQAEASSAAAAAVVEREADPETETVTSAQDLAAAGQQLPSGLSAASAASLDSNSVLSLSRNSSTKSRVKVQAAPPADVEQPKQQVSCQQQGNQQKVQPSEGTSTQLVTEPSFSRGNTSVVTQPAQEACTSTKDPQQQQDVMPTGMPAVAEAISGILPAQQLSAHSPGSDRNLRDALARLKPIRTTGQAAQQPMTHQSAGSFTVAGVRQFRGGRKAEGCAGSNGAMAADASSGTQPAEHPAVRISAAGDEVVMTPMYHKTSSGSLLSLTVQRSTPLKPDILVTSPVVRLHVVDAATGEYVQMMHATSQLQDQQLYEQPGQQCEGAAAGGVDRVSNNGGLLKTTKRHIVEASLQDKMLESLGRPALTTVDNNTACPRPALLEYIPPIQTQPYDMLAGSSKPGHGRVDGTITGLVAEWNEELCIDLSLEQLQERDAVLLLEVLQLPSGFARFQHHVQEFDLAGRCHAVAWSFLRLQGLSGQQQQLQQGKPLQLQLFQYKPAASGHVKSLFKGFKALNPAAAAKAVYLSWILSGFAGDKASAAGSPRQRLQTTLSGLWKSRDGAASPSSAGLLQEQLRSSLPGGLLSPRSGKQATEADKYPGFLQVMVTARPRPVPESMVVVTDPATGLRPNVPAGYGTGFEAGRIPFCLLHKPRALGATAGSRSMKRSQNGAIDAATALFNQQVMMLESRLHRPHTAACQVPNAVLVDVNGSAGGCSCIALSRDGRWLAAACADAAGRFKISLYQALTGHLCWMLGTHDGMVYSMNWARDDSAILTTSADYTAKVFHLPMLPGSKNHPAHSPSSGPLDWLLMLNPATDRLVGPMHATAGTGAATAAAAEAAAEAGVSCTVLQHKCYVYGGELHPVRQPWLLAVTGAYDGCVRVWETDQGQELYSIQVSQSPVNCLTLNQLGSRMFAGDAAGILHELSMDIAPLSGTAAEAFATSMFTTAGRTCNPADANGNSSSGCPCDTAVESLSGGNFSKSPRRYPHPATPRGASATATAEAVSPVAAVIRHGSTVHMMAAGSEVLKVLQSSTELSGSPIVTITCHPGGHQLLVLTKSVGTGGTGAAAAARRSRGLSDLVLVDMKLLMVAKRLGGVKCCSAPLKFAVSPDGEYAICGSEDGSSTIWHLETATATSLPHLTLGGAPVYSMAWSGCFHTVAICSFSAYAPIRVLCFAAEQPVVSLNTPSKEAVAARRNKPQRKAADAVSGDAGSLKRYALPDHLTPHHVHALLADVRAAAVQRGIISAPDDPNGDHLVIKAAPGSHHVSAAHRHNHQLNRSLPGSSTHQQQSTHNSTTSSSTSKSSSAQPAGVIAQLQQDVEDVSSKTLADASEIPPSSAQAPSVTADRQIGSAASASPAGADAHVTTPMLGGRNRQNRRNRVSVTGASLGAGALTVCDGINRLHGDTKSDMPAGDQPSTPKVVVNRNKAVKGGVAAPWLMTQ